MALGLRPGKAVGTLLIGGAGRSAAEDGQYRLRAGTGAVGSRVNRGKPAAGRSPVETWLPEGGRFLDPVQLFLVDIRPVQGDEEDVGAAREPGRREDHVHPDRDRMAGTVVATPGNLWRRRYNAAAGMEQDQEGNEIGKIMH